MVHASPLALASELCDDRAARGEKEHRDDIRAKSASEMIPVVIGFGIIAVLTGALTILLPLVRESQGRSRRRRRRSKRSKGQKTAHTPRYGLDVVAPNADEGSQAEN